MCAEVMLFGNTLVHDRVINADQLTEALLIQDVERNRRGKILRPLGDIIHDKFGTSFNDIETAFVSHNLPELLRQEVLQTLQNDYLLEMEEINYQAIADSFTIYIPHYYRQKTELDRMEQVNGKMVFKQRRCLAYQLNGKADICIMPATKNEICASFVFTFEMLQKKINLNKSALLDALRDQIIQELSLQR